MHARISKPFPRPIAALIALSLAFALAGCGGGQQTLATVGDRVITVADFENAAKALPFTYPGTPDSARHSLVNDLVRQELLLHYGFTSGILVDSIVTADRARMEEQMVRSVLINELVPRTVGVSEAEARRFWAMRDSATRVRMIFVPDRGMMDVVEQELARGDEFEMVAERFNVSGMLPQGGDLGFILPGTLDEPLDSQIRRGAVGDVVGPTQAPGGWYIAKLVDRMISSRDSFAVEAPQIDQALRQRKRRILSQRAFEGLRDQYEVTLAPGAVQAFFAHFNQPGSSPGIGNPSPSPAELAQVLATYDSLGVTMTYTLADALHDLDSSQGERPDPVMLSTFGPWIESRVVNRVLRIEAHRRHLQDTPLIASALEQRLKSELINSVYEQAIAQNVIPTEEDLREAYEMRATPDMPPFDQIPEDMRARLGYDAGEVARRRRLFALTDSLRAATPVTVNEAVLAKLSWPPAGARP